MSRLLVKVFLSGVLTERSALHACPASGPPRAKWFRIGAPYWIPLAQNSGFSFGYGKEGGKLRFVARVSAQQYLKLPG